MKIYKIFWQSNTKPCQPDGRHSQEDDALRKYIYNILTINR